MSIIFDFPVVDTSDLCFRLDEIIITTDFINISSSILPEVTVIFDLTILLVSIVGGINPDYGRAPQLLLLTNMF